MMLPNGKYVLLVLSIAVVCRTLAQDDPYRLPPNYELQHYDVNLVIPAESFTANSSNYSGSVTIQFQVTVSTSEVKLHANSSHITLLTIQLDDDDLLGTDSYSVNSTTNILTLQFPNELIVGQNYTLSITFNSSLVTFSGRALYKTSYTDENGVTQYIAATQFEPTYARSAFPCFDEPRYKATFAYTLTYPADMNALTNTASVSNSTDQTTNLTTTVFGVSPRMPVYLVAFVISKYTCTEGALEGSSTAVHRICSRQERESRRSYALEVTLLIIDGLNNYTGINYTKSLGKLDQIAVSGKSGAMENWGLVLYREGGLLFDNTVQTNTNKQGILAVIAHELAHQWFGNLVTCKWWSEIFLNEGLATMFEYYIADEAQPAFQMVNQFVIRIMHSILTIDGYLNVPALRSNASTDLEISNKFFRYSYYKGAAVLRMIEHVVGREYYRSGIQKYLTDNEYEPAEPEDLWDAIQAVTENKISTLPLNSNISVVMYNWIELGGYPVVNVSLNGTILVLTQQRFLYSGSETVKTSWYIPISYTTADSGDHNEDTSPKGWLTPTEDLTITNFTNSSAWIVVNNQQTGFFRVNYDATLWENLAVALQQSNFSGIHVLNRAQIIQDSYMLARAGLLSFDQVLRNSEFLANDDSYITWYPGITFLNYLLSRIGSISPLGASLTSHFLTLVETVANSVPLETVNEDEHVYTLNQVLVNTNACKYGNAVCVAAAKSLFAIYKATFERPNINTRALVYCNAIRHSDSPTEDWNFLFEQYQNSSVSDDSSRIWSALGCATNTTVLNAFIARLFNSDEVITSSLYTSVFSSIYKGNEVGVDFVLDYFISNYQEIIDLYSAADLSPAVIITGLGAVFTREDQIEKLEAFVTSTSNLPSTITEAAASARTNYTSNQAVVVIHRSYLNGYFGLTEDEESASTISAPATVNTTEAATTTTTITPTTTTTTAATAATTQSTATTTAEDATTAQTDDAVSLRSIGLLSLMLVPLAHLTC